VRSNSFSFAPPRAVRMPTGFLRDVFRICRDAIASIGAQPSPDIPQSPLLSRWRPSLFLNRFGPNTGISPAPQIFIPPFPPLALLKFDSHFRCLSPQATLDLRSSYIFRRCTTKNATPSAVCGLPASIFSIMTVRGLPSGLFFLPFLRIERGTPEVVPIPTTLPPPTVFFFYFS